MVCTLLGLLGLGVSFQEMARRGGPSSAWSFTQGLGDLQESDLDELLWAFVFKTRMAKGTG